MKCGWLVVAVAVLGPAPAAGAQTNDRHFRSWRWPQEPGAARGAGWAGVGVAVPDDAAAGDVNPAALGTLSKSEVYASAVAFGAGQAPVGDPVAAGRALGPSGVAVRASARWTLAFGVAEPRVARLALLPVQLPDGSVDTGTLGVRALDVGAAAAWRLRSRVYVGARLSSTRLTLAGGSRHGPAPGRNDLDVTATGRSTRVTGGVGVTFTPTPKVTLGFARHAGAAYPVSRRATSTLLGVVLDPGSRSTLRRPGTLSAGVHVRFSPRFAAAAQLDVVRYGEVPAGLVIARGARSRDEYRLDDAVEPRLGAEYSLALRRTSLQLRAGLHAQAPGTLRFTGDDAAERAAFPGSGWRLGGAVGASVVASTGFRVDVAGRFGGERPAFLATAAWRF